MMILENVTAFDGHAEDLLEGVSLVIEGGTIKDIVTGRVSSTDADRLDCHGKFVMPGLIDAHFHAYSPSFDIPGLDRMPAALLASHARIILEGALSRGFTTVRDAAGGDIGLWLAIEQGLINGPRFFFSGRAITQTGGHGDPRPGDQVNVCECGSYSGVFSVAADGADAVRKAAREELRKGAHQVKIFVSGGVVSPSDPLWMPQLTNEEIAAAVYEASTRRTYVMAHCHTDDGARRCAELGVRSIEHGTLISADTAAFIAARQSYVVPTLSVADALLTHGASLGLPVMALDKIKSVSRDMLQSIEACRRAGVSLGLGADLLDHRFHVQQGRELLLRTEVDRPIDVLRSATSVNAEILQMPDQLGCLKPGAYADILVLNTSPLKDMSIFCTPERSIHRIFKSGRIVSKSRLNN